MKWLFYLTGFDNLKTYEEGRSRSLEDKVDDGIGMHNTIKILNIRTRKGIAVIILNF